MMPNEMVAQKRFFRPDEVADLLLITKRTVYRMVQDGRLTGVDFNKRPWRIPREAVLNLFDAAPATGELPPPYPDWAQKQFRPGKPGL